ncbi:sensor domain-containing protein [Pseudoalteromonas denitrificans]|uniref:PAS domain S-box-containing protein/diguanylate cyclase (GGDEF) domain-containing protein n=1 Tax=Pseudoalteromonas denitrificans DSM 6059 TaxID=1123010 RepID=A0A1I1LHB6_9GAMM|nr:bifunctional diguanylate cyclase/phosphodiesterase [Pseudoalteromonas denitrificans]SFC72346.1 PAS domain S-box-containing protein/diguanylate cyclase (GGDEF) domain-containing protein [Pseudoalteromonas denitrificans DSM 6059]
MKQTSKARNNQFYRLTENAPSGIFETDPKGHCTYTNKALQKLLGLTLEQTLGQGYATYFHPKDKVAILKYWNRCIAKKQVFSYTFRMKFPNNHQLQLHVNAHPIFDSRNKLIAYVGCVEDISELNKIQSQLIVNQQRYELALKGSSAGVWDWNIKSNSVYYSTKFTDLLGYDNLAFGNNWATLLEQLHPEDVGEFEFQLQQHLDDPFVSFNVECRLFSQKHHELWFQIVGEAIRDKHGIPFRMVGSILDITDKKQSQIVIWQQANFDSLTQLPNRNMFADRLKQEIIKSKRNCDKFALFFIDLDHFKEVNDTLGHDAGDLLLIEASERIKLILRESDTVSRIGGDEFTVILSQIQDNQSIDLVAQKIIQTLELPFYIGNESVFVSASIGITLFPEHTDKMDELLKFSDQAMYQSKNRGRKQFNYFTEQLRLDAEKNHSLMQELRLAIIEQDFEVLYQPIINLSNNKVFKAEALLRWHHAELGMINPADFIPLAESSGIIESIGNWVFTTAAKQVKLWQDEFDPLFQISVNKSPVQFQASNNTVDALWSKTVKELNLHYGICIEITEGLLLEDCPETKEKLSNFQEQGIEISLDDFGTGYASLSYLTKFDINFLKIDQAFVRDLEFSPQNQALCEAIIVMAHKLGLQVIAEGVETQAQMQLLKNAHCDFIQGFLISKPISAKKFTQQLKRSTPFLNR